MKKKAVAMLMAAVMLTACGSIDVPKLGEAGGREAENTDDAKEEAKDTDDAKEGSEEKEDKEDKEKEADADNDENQKDNKEKESDSASSEASEDISEDEYVFDFGEWTDHVQVHKEGDIFQKMLYGDRIIDGNYPDNMYPYQDDCVNIMWKEHPDMTYSYRLDYGDYYISDMPVGIEAAANNRYLHTISSDEFREEIGGGYTKEELDVYYSNYLNFKNLDTADVMFAEKPENPDDEADLSFQVIHCLYKFEDDEVVFAPYDYDSTTYEITLEPENRWFRYKISIDANDVLLTLDDTTIRYKAHDDITCRNGHQKERDYSGNSGQNPYGNIGRISFDGNPYEGEFVDAEVPSVIFGRNVLDYADHPEVTTNGYNFSISWEYVYYGGYTGEKVEEPLTITGSFMAGDSLNMLILVDGIWYDYCGNWDSFYATAGEELTDEQEQEAAEKGDAAKEVIKEALDGSDYTIDDETGTVKLDSSVLFDFDSSELSDEGKAALDDFLEKYIPVIEKQIEEGNLSGLQVDGYTDSTGDISYNQTLSEERAATVVKYISEKYPEIADKLVSNGYGENVLIYNEDGTENEAASRRVEFSFIVAVG